jgi:hypothetical protein
MLDFMRNYTVKRVVVSHPQAGGVWLMTSRLGTGKSLIFYSVVTHKVKHAISGQQPLANLTV